MLTSSSPITFWVSSTNPTLFCSRLQLIQQLLLIRTHQCPCTHILPSMASSLSAPVQTRQCLVQWKFLKWNKGAENKRWKRSQLNILGLVPLLRLTAGWLTAGQSHSLTQSQAVVVRRTAVIGFAARAGGVDRRLRWDVRPVWCQWARVQGSQGLHQKGFLIALLVPKGQKGGRGVGPRWIAAAHQAWSLCMQILEMFRITAAYIAFYE
jgi:hypothetical protein